MSKELDYICLAIVGDPIGLEYVRNRAEDIRAGQNPADRYLERQAADLDQRRREPVPAFDAHPEHRPAKAAFYAQLRREGSL
jgi:hypothetical protein